MEVTLLNNPNNSDNTPELEIDITPQLLRGQTQEDNALPWHIILETSVSLGGFFKLDVAIIGHFRLSDYDSAQPEDHQLIHLNATAILYPYVRAYISSITALSGQNVGTITLPPRFFDDQIEDITPPDDPGQIQKD